jgi:hypothetical protein
MRQPLVELRTVWVATAPSPAIARCHWYHTEQGGR